MTSETSTARCPGCAAFVVPGADWCGLCFSPLTAPVDDAGGFRPGAAQPVRAKIYSDSRWKSGSMTFGPAGRVVFTVLIFLPYPLFFFAFPLGMVGAVLWSIVIVPRALRDIWAPARRHHLPPQD